MSNQEKEKETKKIKQNKTTAVTHTYIFRIIFIAYTLISSATLKMDSLSR